MVNEYSSAAMLRHRARLALQGKWVSAIGAVLLPVLLTFLAGTLLGFLTDTMPVISIVLSLAIMLLTPSLNIGLNCYFLALQQGEHPPYSYLFSRFDNALRNFGLQFMMALLSYLWMLLLIIPGFVAIFRYAMAPYILAEDPDQGIMESIGRSKYMMAGHKGRLFFLELSFFGWYILLGVVSSLLYAIGAPVFTLLGALVMYGGSVVITAYLSSATAAFYLELRGIRNVEGEGEVR